MERAAPAGIKPGRNPGQTIFVWMPVCTGMTVRRVNGCINFHSITFSALTRSEFGILSVVPIMTSPSSVILIGSGGPMEASTGFGEVR